MTAGDVRTIRIPIALDYLAPEDPNIGFIDIGGGFNSTLFDVLSSTIVDVSGKNSVRKTVVTIVGREI